MSTKSPRNENAGRNRKITKFALAGVAVLGVGAALTSAAWTDNVFFAADASSGTIDLVGRVADGDYDLGTGDWEQGPIAIDPAILAGLAPTQPKSVVLEVLNDSDGELRLIAPAISLRVGTFFDGIGSDDIPITFSAYSQPVIGPQETATITMTLTPPDWNDVSQGISGNTFSLRSGHDGFDPLIL